MTWVWVVLALLLLLDGFRVRRRLRALAVLAPTDEAASPAHVFLTAAGVNLDEATRRSASAHARATNTAQLDLVPGDLPALRAWGLLQFVDPDAYRKDRLGKGVTAGHAMLVDKELLERARVAADTWDVPRDPVEFIELAARLKHYSRGAADLVVAPSLPAAAEDRRRLATLRATVGSGANAVLIGVPVLLAILAVGAVTDRRTGFLPLAAFHLQPLVAFAASRLRAKGLVLATLFRAPLEFVRWLGLLRDRTVPPARIAADACREGYDKLIAGGLDRFFEPRIEACPVCKGRDLELRFRTVDLLQHKPGTFAIEHCVGCGHLFQNPRLSLEGLDFYYRDFYDGLGEQDIDAIFGWEQLSYLARARCVKGLGEPRRWLDVGGGHGHFCFAAREVWPDTRFDALDLSASIDEAARRGWVDEGFVGLFPDLAPTMSGAYDVVSMSHYLEHTRDPRAEIEAARTALAPRGLLLVEVPDPECTLGSVLGRLWLPFFQPQHQHLLSVGNIERLLRERGFSPLLWHRGEAHQPVDVFGAVYLLLGWLAPPPDEPWRPPGGALSRALRAFVLVLGTPALIFGRAVDALLAPVLRRARASNTYRVVARRDELKDEGRDQPAPA